MPTSIARIKHMHDCNVSKTGRSLHFTSRDKPTHTHTHTHTYTHTHTHTHGREEGREGEREEERKGGRDKERKKEERQGQLKSDSTLHQNSQANYANRHSVSFHTL